MTTDLITWLRAQLDDDEQKILDALARERLTDVQRWSWVAWPQDGPSCLIPAVATPARVLADIAAKRKLIKGILEYVSVIDAEWGCCHTPKAIEAGECPDHRPNDIDAIRDLASAYADRSGYRQEWAP